MLDPAIRDHSTPPPPRIAKRSTAQTAAAMPRVRNSHPVYRLSVDDVKDYLTQTFGRQDFRFRVGLVDGSSSWVRAMTMQRY